MNHQKENSGIETTPLSGIHNPDLCASGRAFLSTGAFLFAVGVWHYEPRGAGLLPRTGTPQPVGGVP